MSDYSEATAALDKATEIIEDAKRESDHAERLGKLLLLKETANQAVKFQRRAFLAAAGFGNAGQTAMDLGDGQRNH